MAFRAEPARFFQWFGYDYIGFYGVFDCQIGAPAELREAE
jgi:hypothetical protein